MNIDSIATSVISDLHACAAFQVAVYWLEEKGDRDQLYAEVIARFSGSRVVAHVLRRPLFTDPNAWAADSMSVIDSLRSEVESVSEGRRSDAPLGLVIIARNKLQVAQSSSPAIAPAWLPNYEGRRIMVVARDVKALASCSLASDEGAIDAIKSSLFEMEVALLRLAEVRAAQRHHGQRLWGELLKDRSGLERKSQFLEHWRQGLAGVSDANSYRPSLRFGWSLVSAMWDTFLRRSPAQLLSSSEAFVEYFGITIEWTPQPPHSTPLIPVLFRSPDDLAKDQDVVAGRSIILLVGAACQLVTAAAHADQYGRVNAAALDAVSKELRFAISTIEQRARWAVDAARPLVVSESADSDA